MNRNRPTTSMPYGTTIATADVVAAKTGKRGDPHPWKTADCEYDNEWAARQLADGAAILDRWAIDCHTDRDATVLADYLDRNWHGVITSGPTVTFPCSAIDEAYRACVEAVRRGHASGTGNLRNLSKGE